MSAFLSGCWWLNISNRDSQNIKQLENTVNTVYWLQRQWEKTVPERKRTSVTSEYSWSVLVSLCIPGAWGKCRFWVYGWSWSIMAGSFAIAQQAQRKLRIQAGLHTLTEHPASHLIYLQSLNTEWSKCTCMMQIQSLDILLKL